MRSTLISAAFGWWGLPWGPIYTVVHGLKNAFGGQANRGIDEQLMWQNTIAFGRRGNVDLAGTLASHLINASDRDLGEAAWHLKTAIEADGHKIRPFKSAWRFNYGNAFRQLASLAVVPLVTGAVAYGIFDTSNRSTASDGRPKLNFDDLPSEKSIASIPKPALDFSENGTPVNQCINPPHNGQVLLKRIALSKGGHRLTIKNGTSGDAIIKVRNEFGNHTQVSFFVANNSIASISGLPDGRYKIQFATGDALLANCKAFVTPNASEFNSTETFSTTYTSTQIISLELELTLYAVSGGNARTSNVDAASFQSD